MDDAITAIHLLNSCVYLFLIIMLQSGSKFKGLKGCLLKSLQGDDSGKNNSSPALREHLLLSKQTTHTFTQSLDGHINLSSHSPLQSSSLKQVEQDSFFRSGTLIGWSKFLIAHFYTSLTFKIMRTQTQFSKFSKTLYYSCALPFSYLIALLFLPCAITVYFPEVKSVGLNYIFSTFQCGGTSSWPKRMRKQKGKILSLKFLNGYRSPMKPKK